MVGFPHDDYSSVVCRPVRWDRGFGRLEKYAGCRYDARDENLRRDVRKHLFVWERKGVKKVKKKINFWSGTLPGKLLLLSHRARKVLFTGLVDCGGVIVHYLLSNGKKQAHPSHHTAKPTSATQKSRRSKLVVSQLMFRFQPKQGIPKMFLHTGFIETKEYLESALAQIADVNSLDMWV